MEKDLEILNLTVPTLSIRESKALLAGDGYGWEGPSTYDYDLDVGDAPRFDFPQVIEIELPEIVVVGERTATNRDNDIDPIGVPDIDIDIADRDSSQSSEQEDDPSPSFDRDDDHSHSYEQDTDRDNDRDGDYDTNNDVRDNDGDKHDINAWENFDINAMLANAESQGDFQYACVFASVYALLAGYGKVPEGMTSWRDLAKSFLSEKYPDIFKLDMEKEDFEYELLRYNGTSNHDVADLIKQYFDTSLHGENYRQARDSSFVSGFLNALNTATQERHPLLVTIGKDTDNKPGNDVGHMVVVIEFVNNGDKGSYFVYWDPSQKNGGLKSDIEVNTGNVIAYWLPNPKD